MLLYYCIDEIALREDILIFKTRDFSVEQDWTIPIPGFFVIISKRNIKSILDLTDKETKEFIYLLRRIRKGMKEILKIDEVYLFQNEDSDSPFHLWIFPRYRWMEKFGRKIQSVRPIMNYAKENMLNEKVAKEVKEYVKKMSLYMKG